MQYRRIYTGVECGNGDMLDGDAESENGKRRLIIPCKTGWICRRWDGDMGEPRQRDRRKETRADDVEIRDETRKENQTKVKSRLPQ